MNAQPPRDLHFLPRSGLDALIRRLQDLGYEVIGPVVDQNAIVYGPVCSAADLPCGWTDRQEAGTYRLERRDDDALFGYVVGPHSWKRYLFPPVSLVAAADRRDGQWEFSVPVVPDRPQAFLGVRACELAAMRIQDRVFLEGPYVDPGYQQRRQSALIVAVNCTQAAPTCFCTSMQTGPRCQEGFDLSLTEIPEGFLLDIGSERGRAVCDGLPLRDATNAEQVSAARARAQAERQISRRLETADVPELLRQNLQSPHWQNVAQRCLSCTNCTLVCPTCFCASVEDVPAIDGDHVDRERRWDSCFNPEFSYLHSGIARDSIASRYRQWLTHKLSTWHDQFGTSGCVGCGRCITWCPVGIDLTAEVSAIRVLASASQASGSQAPAAAIVPMAGEPS
jgi:sulfhydrogenase subunit beta (sulfur reductase)